MTISGITSGQIISSNRLMEKEQMDKMRELRKISNDIKQIQRETDYIKENGKIPPRVPNYYSK